MDLEERWQAAQVAYTKKIRTAARRSDYVSHDHSAEDMEQELLIVLWECCSLYDPNKGASFNAFFWLRAKQRIGRLRTRASTQKRSASVISLDDDAVKIEVSEILSAEDEYLAQEAVRQRGGGNTVAWYLQRQVELYATG